MVRKRATDTTNAELVTPVDADVLTAYRSGLTRRYTWAGVKTALTTAFDAQYLSQADAADEYAPLTLHTAANDLGRVLAWDSANRPNGAIGTADSGHVWTDHLGNWQVVDGTIQATAPGSGTRRVTMDLAANITADFTMRYSNGNGGLMFRANDPANYLDIRVTASDVQIRKVVAGSATVLATSGPTSHAVGSFNRYRVRVFGPTITVWQEFTQVATHTLTGDDASTFAAGTLVGFWSNNATPRHIFDDFIVRAS